MTRDFNENKFKLPKGHINMVLFEGNYDKETGKIDGKILQEYDEHNLIVNMASNFMAARMAPSDGSERITSEVTTDENGIKTTISNHENSTDFPLAYGFQYLALGDGNLNELSEDEKGDYLYNPDANFGTDQQRQATKLLHETIRRKITNWSFLNEDGTIVEKTLENPDGVSNILKLSTLFEESDEENNFIVEMALFGGNATEAADSGYMFNYKMFKSWNKIAGSSLLVNWIITF